MWFVSHYLRSEKLETLRILVAEDHPLFRKGMVSLLSSVADFEVIGEAATGEEAVALAADLQPDVVLMDLQMPVMDGVTATRTIMAERLGVDVLVLTSYSDGERIVAALDAQPGKVFGKIDPRTTIQ